MRHAFIHDVQDDPPHGTLDADLALPNSSAGPPQVSVDVCEDA